jgi:methyl-accepting chemotaxis protein
MPNATDPDLGPIAPWHGDCPKLTRRYFIKHYIPMAFITVATLLTAGCATKSYVRKSVDPVNGKVDQVASKTDRNGQAIDQTNQNLDQTRQNLEKDETQLSATSERALSADNKAGQAMDSATQANQKADRLSTDLRNVVSNLDDYKQVAQTTVNFKFNSEIQQRNSTAIS